MQCRLDDPSWTWTQTCVQTRLPDYRLNWTARPSTIQGWQSCQWCSSPYRMWPNWNQEPFGLKSNFKNNARLGQNQQQNNAVDICLCLPPDRTWNEANDPKIDYREDLGEGKFGHEPKLKPCWIKLASNHLVQCGPDVPSWTLNQTWVNARMPDYSWKWAARSSAIQSWKTC